METVYVIKKIYQYDPNGPYVAQYKDNNITDQYTDYITKAKQFPAKADAISYIVSVFVNHTDTIFQIEEIIIPS